MYAPKNVKPFSHSASLFCIHVTAFLSDVAFPLVTRANLVVEIPITILFSSKMAVKGLGQVDQKYDGM